MGQKSTFVHVGLTVSNIQKTVEFYSKYFGFTLEEEGVFSEEFIAAKPMLYKQKPNVYSKYAMIKSPDGVVLELFEFVPQIAAKDALWHQPGYHHICLKVPDTKALYEQMVADGCEYYFEPEEMAPGSPHHWVFLKDPDGNMIELQD
ncbi:VOC family protein [Aeribacillus composti]|uniref:VOC family protein n=1 Tax=Aeribacillus composti TaxID=1868734 RepID=UPI002E2173FC|nr:VOC family protein [Aeribacillus composti]